MMTEIALVADLHGNWPATEAVDRDIRARGIRRVWCLGDVVGKGPSSDRTFDWAVERCELILKGNWDEGVGRKQFPNDQFYYDQLGEQRLAALTQWPYEYECCLSGRKTRLFHGRFTMPAPYGVHENAELLAPYFLPDYDVVGYGDCHRQCVRLLNNQGILFNTGSVGNGLGVPMAQYVILRCEPDSRELAPLDIVTVTVPYDREQAVRDTREAGKRGMPNAVFFEQEILTGVYARANGREKP